MPLHIPTYTSERISSGFKQALILILFTAIMPFVQAQKGMKEHQKLVAQSRFSKTAVCSRDTFFCSGNALAVVQYAETRSNKDMQASLMPFGATEPVIRFKPVDETWQTFRFDFPGFGQSCEVFLKQHKDPFSLICHYELLNALGLDTLKAEIFMTLYAAKPYAEPSRPKMPIIDAEKALVVKRNTGKPVLVQDDNLAQDGVLIGTFERDTIDGPKGKHLQLKISNSVGALICTATEGSRIPGTDLCEWSFISFKDNKFHTVKLVSNDELLSLVRHLIAAAYL
jgi:hypothetical protein